MLNKEEVLNRLKGVIYPGFEKDIVSFGFVKNIEIGEKITIEVEIVSSSSDVANELKTDIKRVMGSNEYVLNLIQPKIPEEKSNTQSGKNIAPQVKNFVMVSSGKGGVGKSTTTLNLAISMAKLGKKVGILDADIYGPNIPRMLGEVNTQPQVVGNKLKPILSHGVEMMSMGVLMEEGMSLIWRGSMIMKAIEQLLRDVLWSELDVLFLDMPPGTGDVALTVFQSLPVEGVVIVSSPQDLVQMVVGKAVRMAEMMHVPVFGLIENMAYITCPHCDERIEPYGPSKLAETAAAFNLKLLGQLPMDAIFAQIADKGTFSTELPEGLVPDATQSVLDL